MNANDNKDFIDKFFDIFEPWKKTGVRLFAITMFFLCIFCVGCFLSPAFIRLMQHFLPFPIELYQLSPLEVIFCYCKIAFFLAIFTTLPFFVYQFGKLKVKKVNFDSRLDLLIAALILSIIIIISFVLTLIFIFPAESTFLYGLNFDVATFSSSLLNMTTSFITTFIFTVLLILLPFIRILIKKSLLFNYATLIKYKKTVMIYAAIITGILVLPLELICLCFVFLMFFVWYKIIIHFSKKSD